MNYRLTAFILSEIAFVIGAVLLVPLFYAIGLGETATPLAFGVTVAICAGLGIISLLFRPSKDKRQMRPSCGMIICGMAWILFGLIGAVPYRLSGFIPNYMDAVFESISGITTTGASIINNVEAFPKSLLLWRSLSQWLGGMGVLVFMIAILPKGDKTATQLAKAEIPGPQFGKLVSKLRFTARILYGIYLAMTLLLIGILCICKMPVFDSFCTAFSTASTGGFSVRNTSIAAYDSLSVEIVLTVFMVLFSVNFNVYFMIVTGQILKALKNEETLTMIGFYCGIVFILTLILCLMTTTYSVGNALRDTSFTAASLMSTTGFSTADYTSWPIAAQVLLLAMMFVGGSAGSTAGGMKVSRAIILGKTSMLSAKKMFSPRSVTTVRLDGRVVSEDTVKSVTRFFIDYMLIFLLSTLLVSLDKSLSTAGSDGFMSAMGAVASSQNNIGPGFALLGPTFTYSNLTHFSKVVLCFDMLIGRLEVMPIVIMLYPRAWYKI